MVHAFDLLEIIFLMERFKLPLLIVVVAILILFTTTQVFANMFGFFSKEDFVNRGLVDRVTADSSREIVFKTQQSTKGARLKGAAAAAASTRRALAIVLSASGLLDFLSLRELIMYLSTSAWLLPPSLAFIFVWYSRVFPSSEPRFMRLSM